MNTLKLLLAFALLAVAVVLFSLFGGAILLMIETSFPEKIAMAGFQMSLANWICVALCPITAIAVVLMSREQ